MSSRNRQHSALRVVRGGLLAVSSAGLTITAHGLADGGLPDLPLTVLLTALIGWTATALAGKARGPLATVAVLGGGQLVMHLVLTTLMADSHAMAAAPLSGGVGMTGAHVVATLAIALLLTKADTLLLSTLSCLRARLPLLSLALPVPAAAPAPVLARPAGPGHLVGVDFRHVLGRRGPPVFS